MDVKQLEKMAEEVHMICMKWGLDPKNPRDIQIVVDAIGRAMFDGIETGPPDNG